jgi:histidinol-phosphatase (PHP family)
LSTPDIDISIRPSEIGSYLKDIENSQETTDVRLLKGLEVDYIPSDEKKIEKILDEYNLDIVLGSIHYVNGADIGSRKSSPLYFSGRKLSEAVDEYYDVWSRAIETGLFDVMAHPDYWRKYVSQVHSKEISWEDYGVKVYEALDSLVTYDIGIEVNTSGYKHGLKSNFPLECFLEEAKKAGLSKVTIGSDSHTVSELGLHYTNAVSQLKKLGFKTLYKYKNRRSTPVKLYSF